MSKIKVRRRKVCWRSKGVNVSQRDMELMQANWINIDRYGSYHSNDGLLNAVQF